MLHTKRTAAILALLLALSMLLTACDKGATPTGGDTSNTPETSATAPATQKPETTPSETPEVSQTPPATDYVGMFSAEEVAAALKCASKHYEKMPFKLLSDIELVADDAHGEYTGAIMRGAAIGNVIIFRVQTTHAGAGVYRQITIVRENKDADWQVQSGGEGY
ncbi:hypothetical protein FACS1894217_03000 [Clostridia bacterium]|nr:hypothetical protein FACS1894217_03000 [Clostridia bacterium]